MYVREIYFAPLLTLPKTCSARARQCFGHSPLPPKYALYRYHRLPTTPTFLCLIIILPIGLGSGLRIFALRPLRIRFPSLSFTDPLQLFLPCVSRSFCFPILFIYLFIYFLVGI